MLKSFEEYCAHLFDLCENERAHIELYKEYQKKHALDDKHDYFSSIYVSSAFFEGRDLGCHFHDRFSAPNYHTHAFFELIYIVDGEFVNVIEGHEITMKKGDFCLLPPHIYHSFDVVEKDLAKREKSFAINIFIDEQSAPRYFSGLGSRSLDRFISAATSHTNHRKFAFFTRRGESICDNLVKLLSYSLHERGHTSEQCAASLMRAIAAELHGSSYLLSFSPSFTNNSAVGDIIKYISDNSRTVTLEEVASNFNYSFSYASKLIKQRTGLKFSELLSSIRIGKACKMLSETELTIKAICDKCGYGSLEHFHRAFKKAKGMTPIAYREYCEKEKS